MSHIRKIVDHNKNNPLFTKADHKPHVEKPISVSAKAAASDTDPRIDMLVYRRKLDTDFGKAGSFYILVKFYSHVQPNWLVQAPIELAGKSERELDFEVGVLCGAMAERLDELYGDKFDPDKAARAGSGKLSELLREWERQSSRK